MEKKNPSKNSSNFFLPPFIILMTYFTMQGSCSELRKARLMNHLFFSKKTKVRRSTSDFFFRTYKFSTKIWSRATIFNSHIQNSKRCLYPLISQNSSTKERNFTTTTTLFKIVIWWFCFGVGTCVGNDDDFIWWWWWSRCQFRLVDLVHELFHHLNSKRREWTGLNSCSCYPSWDYPVPWHFPCR